MKWGTFSLSQMPDQLLRSETFDADFRQFELAEELGFDTIWIAEHLFSTYGVVTSTQVLAAAIAMRTKKISIGTAVVVIPFNHPLRTASDFALVDILSHGRLKFGVGRAYQPHEFLGLGVPMEQSREMYNEGLDIVLKAWTQDTVSFDGKFWKAPNAVEVLPKPHQRPHPPVYQATISPESFDQAARLGVHLQLAAPFTYRTYRERWKDELQKSLKGFEAKCKEHGRDGTKVERMMLFPFYVAETDEAAKRHFQPHVEWFYNKVAAHQQSVGAMPATIKGYELGMIEGKKTREMGYLAFDKLTEHHAAIVGSPERCVDALREAKERFGLTEIALWTNLGGIDPRASERAMRLIMDKVAPHV
jgi:alkanesulfonate monooxygenase SsuD/methylene tetrahydromethanopterin reductase-like flavin-dependent oxidoreductase (luciferase family)